MFLVSLAEDTDPDGNTVLVPGTLIPHTLVLKPGLVVHSIYNGYWSWLHGVASISGRGLATDSYLTRL